MTINAFSGSCFRVLLHDNMEMLFKSKPSMRSSVVARASGTGASTVTGSGTSAAKARRTGPVGADGGDAVDWSGVVALLRPAIPRYLRHM
jgi:hypothetical protein